MVERLHPPRHLAEHALYLRLAECHGQLVQDQMRPQERPLEFSTMDFSNTTRLSSLSVQSSPLDGDDALDVGEGLFSGNMALPHPARPEARKQASTSSGVSRLVMNTRSRALASTLDSIESSSGAKLLHSSNASITQQCGLLPCRGRRGEQRLARGSARCRG